ncbi:MAG: chemotaxis protein CheW [Gomphosphaeria aponina SAG 52.96 = DSM 107014]|uniref:Chemotaxis protein CheW n=1 Tax=Gomphosphaeria aponina SAG 52.96 = DSM 107014 TaxID=1521640 RepID=A0A941GT29_9CHRO|nr:chemotaxis protein CheW [Gomphosphaeria aponina SAG 52.96 = DSM 107014]
MYSTPTKQQRFILAQLNELTLVFPAEIVEEILIVEREQILNLPFYDPAVMGCVHTAGGIIPLISLHQIFGLKFNKTKKIHIVRLNEKAGKMGLVVERVIGSQNEEQLPPDLFNSDKMQLFRPEMINSNLWQPRHW